MANTELFNMRMPPEVREQLEVVLETLPGLRSKAQLVLSLMAHGAEKYAEAYQEAAEANMRPAREWHEAMAPVAVLIREYLGREPLTATVESVIGAPEPVTK